MMTRPKCIASFGSAAIDSRVQLQMNWRNKSSLGPFLEHDDLWRVAG
jgi:hypothetical protein